VFQRVTEQIKVECKCPLDREVKMNHYILVHGAWLGAWCWDKVIPRLQQSGATVHAQDLPGHGLDQTPPQQCTVEGYVDSVVKLIQLQKTPVVLVGHSMAGLVITQVAERIPENIACLVYVSAYLLKNGETINQVNAAATDSAIPANVILAPDFSTAGIREEALREVFCADAAEEDAAKLEKLYRPEPGAAGQYVVNITDAKWGRVPRAYIRTTKDRAVTPSMQQRFLSKTPCNEVWSLESSHSPFFARADELTHLLLEAAKMSARSAAAL
jgi:pimeloyl-ACP methyl ester carboxylesterase